MLLLCRGVVRPEVRWATASCTGVMEERVARMRRATRALADGRCVDDDDVGVAPPLLFTCPAGVAGACVALPAAPASAPAAGVAAPLRPEEARWTTSVPTRERPSPSEGRRTVCPTPPPPAPRRRPVSSAERRGCVTEEAPTRERERAKPGVRQYLRGGLNNNGLCVSERGRVQSNNAIIKRGFTYCRRCVVRTWRTPEPGVLATRWAGMAACSGVVKPKPRW